MFSSGPHAVIKTPASLVCGIVNNALLHSSPTINHTLPQIVHILHFCLVDSLLHYTPDLYSTGLRLELLGDQKSVEMNAGVLHSRRLIVSRARALGRCLAERRRTHQRPDVWQAATVVTVAHHDNRLHRPWLRDWRISNWCSLILTRRLTRSVTG